MTKGHSSALRCNNSWLEEESVDRHRSPSGFLEPRTVENVAQATEKLPVTTLEPRKSKTKVMAVWCPVRVAVIVNSPTPHVLTWQGAKRQKVSYLVSILCLYLQRCEYQEGSHLTTPPPPEALPLNRIPLGNGRGHRYAESHLGLGKIWIHASLSCLRWWRCCCPNQTTLRVANKQTNKHWSGHRIITNTYTKFDCLHCYRLRLPPHISVWLCLLINCFFYIHEVFLTTCCLA